MGAARLGIVKVGPIEDRHNKSSIVAFASLQPASSQYPMGEPHQIQAITYRIIASFADFYIVSFVHYARRCNEENFTGLVLAAPALQTLYDGCGQWLKKED